MKVFVLFLVFLTVVFAQGPPPPRSRGPPQINWGQCESLKPTEEERGNKKKIIDQCLKDNPLPDGDLTKEQLNQQTDKITTCALKAENWFGEDGKYKFDRAKEELEAKKLPKEIEGEVAKKHDSCKNEAVEKFPEEKLVAQQIQLYQACMDFHISKLCGIEVVPPGHPPHEGPHPGSHP